MRRISVVVLVAALMPVFSAASIAQTRRVEVGTLSCDVAPSVGLILGSQQRLSCLFKSRATGRTESYTGAINRLGLDVGVSAGGKLLWRVHANRNLAARPLAGTFVGASGDVSLVAGVGANALVGGSNNSIALQPLSVKGQVGVNLALGIANMTLQ